MTFKPGINPVALKELRQLVRSRLILWGMVALPIILLAAMALVLSVQTRDLSPTEIALGKGFGEGTLIAVSIITGIVTRRSSKPARRSLDSPSQPRSPRSRSSPGRSRRSP